MTTPQPTAGKSDHFRQLRDELAALRAVVTELGAADPAAALDELRRREAAARRLRSAARRMRRALREVVAAYDAGGKFAAAAEAARRGLGDGNGGE